MNCFEYIMRRKREQNLTREVEERERKRLGQIERGEPSNTCSDVVFAVHSSTTSRVTVFHGWCVVRPVCDVFALCWE